MANKQGTGQRKTIGNTNENTGAIKKVIEFLQVFLPITLAKRLVAIVLLGAGVPAAQVTELTGLCDRSTRGLLKSMGEEEIESLLTIKSGSGKKSKMFGLETEILQEIEKNNYHTRQQIADMIKEKFHVQVSVSAVGRLLKKRDQKAEKRFASCKGRYGKAARVL